VIMSDAYCTPGREPRSVAASVIYYALKCGTQQYLYTNMYALCMYSIHYYDELLRLLLSFHLTSLFSAELLLDLRENLWKQVFIGQIPFLSSS